MAFAANKMDFQARVPLPSMVQKSFGEWFDHFGKILTSGYRTRKPQELAVLDEMVVKRKEIVVHSFTMGDVDDPDLMAGEPLWKWQNSVEGQWVIEHAVETPVWHRIAEPMVWGHKYIITATLREKHITEFYLRFGNANKGLQV